MFLCFVLPCVLQDPYNKERIALVKKLKVDGVAWVSKYARGGSARSLSARRWVGPGMHGLPKQNGLVEGCWAETLFDDRV